MSRVAVFLMALVALASCAYALSGDDLMGEYDVDCVPARSNGGTDRNWHRDSNVWMSSNQMREHAKIYDGDQCDGKVQYEFDFSAFYVIGAEIEQNSGIFQLTRNFRDGMKNVVARSKEGQQYLEETCVGTLFPRDVWVNVIDLTCAPILFGCANQNNVEYGCITQDDSKNVQFCEVGNTHPEGPCLPGLGSTVVDSVVYAYDKELQAPTNDDIAGNYGFTCEELAGLPAGWRISEELNVNGDEQYRRTELYSNPLCKGSPALLLDRWQQYVTGPFYEDFADQYLPTFEQNTKFVGQKNLRVKSVEGKAFMDALCGADFPLNDWVDVAQLQCAPFLFNCGVELTCMYQDPIDGSLDFCTRDPVEGSCTPQFRTQEYFGLTYNPDAASALVPSLLLVAALVALLF
mmetsp:Transcript_27890/g.69942  ORF Transcript_27890/g.69942 Transcript_27890/m.69942 type:complete len:404 (-) Transcript_27890:43-1254(-)|eukprot:CAMPEP_0174229186 /NCGR_PEP_ID=MMETSP0417-20130205/226_1 /TAXON_ID=242541 /ORGANISM="Mayorella sp, Strain BSH-02190019" /LENGTH=403 /DNA_ID=CAMNT_0015306709 /DNA_START=76 /DNA_END=1287 /DNA_ORIENTATION=-